jgi:molybdopterin synthase catalytic subunit
MVNEQITVKVRFFAAPREALGFTETEVTVPPGTSAGELIGMLTEDYPVLRSYTRFVNVAVNRAYVGMQAKLSDGDELALLPPVGGG